MADHDWNIVVLAVKPQPWRMLYDFLLPIFFFSVSIFHQGFAYYSD